MVLGPGHTVMSKRNVAPAFMACVEDVTGQNGEDRQKTSKPENTNSLLPFYACSFHIPYLAFQHVC